MNHPHSFLRTSKLLKAFKLLSLGILLLSGNALAVRAQDPSACPPPVLSRLQRHRVAAGETLDAIARQYNLIPETLTRFNPGGVSVGREIVVPPMNGMRVQAPRGATWKDLEAAYGVRADLLFELNGCTAKPNVVFIPGINWSSSGSNSNPRGRDYLGLTGYPLANRPPIGYSYGWQTDTATETRRFHSGIDLLAEVGTPVLAAESGTVAFAGQQGNYGNLVIISHAGNLQTRYAHLGQVTVQVGQQVRVGQPIGAVGTTGQPDIASPHLHFEVRQQSSVGWVARDPEVYLKAENSGVNF